MRSLRSKGDRNQGGRIDRALLLLLPLLALGLAPSGCHYHDEDGGCAPDWRAPAAPRGLTSVTGDGRIDLFWFPNTESDLEGYRIYRSTEPRGYFPRIATVGAATDSYVDRSVNNGTTYYYAIAAFDDSGNESDETSETIYDTPRPAGNGLRLYNAESEPGASGYDFSRREVLDYRELDADIYYWSTQADGPWMIATERSADQYSDIQDAGYVELDAVDWAPAEGWAPTGEVPLILGHCYVVWTWDNHFAKFRVVSLEPDRVVLDWAYQIDPGNAELSLPSAQPARPAGGGGRVHQRGMERRIQ